MAVGMRCYEIVRQIVVCLVLDGALYARVRCLFRKTLYGYKAKIAIIAIIANSSLVGDYLAKVAPQRVCCMLHPPAFRPVDSAQRIMGG